MSGAAQSKAALRDRMRRALAALSPGDRREKGERIVRRLSAVPDLERAGRVMLYAAVEAWGEVEVASLAERLLSSGRRVAVPHWRAGDASTPRAAWIAEWGQDLAPGAGPPRLPRPGLPEAHPTEIDAVVLPGLAFDGHGRRLGRGGGWYDRFLAGLRTDAVRIGLAFDVQILDGGLPAEPHDQRVHLVVTETRLITVAGRAGPSGP